MSQKKITKKIACSIMQYCAVTFLLCTLFQTNAYSLQDSLHINLKANQISISGIFKVVHKQTGYIVFYNNNILNDNQKLNVDFVNENVKDVMNYVIRDKDLTYLIKDHLIVLQKKQAESTFMQIRENTSPPRRLISELQEFNVSGVVKASSGETLSGVSVTLKGSTVGTSTNSKGEYSISLPNGEGTLIFSFTGFETREVRVNNQSTIDIRLEVAATSLNQIVVTALGIRQEKRTLSYSTQAVAPEQLTEARELNVINSLEGKVAGLNISQSGSGVGAASRVTLRGNRSISGDSQPLYVIDGVPTLGAPEDLDPDDFASIDILKGANAAALYGSDAQNGAIVITTKKGSSDRVHVSLNNTVMFQKADLGGDFQNEYGQGTGGVFQSGAIYSWGPKIAGQTVASWTLDPSSAGETYALTPQPNNVSDLFQTGYTLSHNLQASLGGKNTQTFFSTTSTEGQGILPNNNLLRNNVLVRMTGNLSDKFTFDAKISYTRQNTDNPTRQSDNNFNPMQQVYLIPRNIRTEDAKKYEFPDVNGVMQQNFWSPGVFSTAENPYWVINRNISNDELNRVTGLASLKYDFTKDLNFMVRAAYDRIDDNYEQKDYNGTLVRALYGRYTITKSDNYIFNTDFLLSYNKKFNTDWTMDLHAGGNSKRLGNQSLSSNTGDALLVPNLFSMSNTNLPQTSFDPGSPINIQSLYAFGNFGWKDAIFATITGRNDWSSTLPANSRSYFYPSAGVSAILSKLIPSFPKVFSFAKVRASWAQVGSSAPPFMLQRTASFTSGGSNGFLSFSNVL
ncbi:MAG: SusC/RagA family TonB-linked outer membrane protein, partial [Ginsengibacter sp.]